MRAAAIIVWTCATILAAACVFLLLLGFGISRAGGETDAMIWHEILFECPVYLLPTWTVIGIVCAAEIRRNPKKDRPSGDRPA